MDDGNDDGYVPQISQIQIDYNLMDSGTNGNSSVPGYNNMYANAEMHHHQQQFAPHHGYPPGIPGQMNPAMMPGQMMNPAMMPTAAQAVPQQPAAKPKRGGGRKKANQSAAESQTQPLPASYPSHQMNPQMMQMRQQSAAGNPYNYPVPSQAQQKWPADYMQQQQYRPNQQGYPGYPMHPSAQNYYAANQQRPPPQYWPGQQGYPAGAYPGQNPQQARYPTPQPNQQQYYMDPSMYNYPPHGSATGGYPQAASSNHSQQQGQQSSFQQAQTPSQPNPYQQPKATPSAMTPISQANHMPTPYGQQAPGSSQQPNSQWPPPYNGVPSNYYPQQPMNSVQNLQRELAELERQYQQCSYQQKTMEVSMRMEQIYKRTCTVKQQLMSMQQPQQSPQNANNKGYPNYPSNGQIMDSSTANSTISPMSSNSSLHHSQSTEKAPARTPTVSTQDPNSSVSVMQTTPNQVQVNITPESIPGGRTLISVYHQYPGSDVMTNSTNATASTTSNYTKDTVPPEPLPPSLSADQQQMYGRNQHQNNGQLPLSSAPSTSTINSTTTVESKSNSIANTTAPSADYSNFSSQQTTNSTQPDLSPIPPQPIPTTSYNSNSEVQRQFPTENASETTKLVDESSVSSINNAKEHAIERVGNSHVEDTKPVISTTLESNLLKSNEESTKDSLADKSTDQLENTNETESFENELEDLQPPAAPRMITTNFEEDEDEYESEVVENKEASKQSVDEIETQSTVPLQNTKVEMVENDALPVKVAPELEKHEVPVVEVKLEAKSRPIKEKPIPTIVEPSTSANESMEVTEKQEDSIADDEEPLADSTMEIEMEEAATKAKSQPKKKPKSKPPAKSRKSTSGGQNQRKRKKPESEEEEDPISDNEEFVPEAPSKKRSKGKATAVAKIPVLEEPKLEDFVEKRRSERNRAERKTYSEKMDIDEDLLEEIQTIVEAPSLNDSPSQATQPEWIVEKILGVRIVTKMLPKEPEEEEIEEPKDETKQEAVNPADTEQPAENPETSSEAVEKANDEGKEVVENGEKKKNGDETDKKSTKEPEEVELEEVQVEEIYVKFKGKSYLHCEWKSVEELEEMDRRIGGKINRFKAKYGEAYLDDSEYFNEDYTVVDRVLDEHIDEETGEHSAFIKWRSLAYEDCTWEDIEIVPKLKLEEYHRRNDTIDSFKTKERARPQPEEWAKIPKDKQYKFENTLRDYQVEGVNWLLYCWFNRQNCILADEMGLGKTIQTITFLQGVYDKGIHGPFLIVVPLSTLHNWEREFETWTDMNAVVYHGGAASREVIQNYEIFYDRTDSKKKQIYKFDALLTTYEMVVSDCEFLRKINYRVCVIDEAHRLKNRNSKLLTGGLHSFKMEHRVLLTGTPLQNNIQELFSLLNFLEPEQFGNSDSFLEQFGQCQTEEQVQKLQEILKPMMLRRLKEDVEKTLQPKEETIIEVQLTNAQKKYYRAILERNFTHLIKGTSVPSLMNVMMQLRHVCNHPFLLRGAEEQIISEFKASHPEKSEEDLQMFSLIQASGKLVLIDKLLPKLRQDGHKVLIFSQMVRVLDILEEFLVQMNYTYERIDGNIRGDHRQAAIDRFSKPDSDRFVFLLCTRAGGLGINLTAADTVIIFDSDWNPQNDLQAQARCHRIGQTKMVKVYRLITANTYERDMFDKASLKLGLDKAVLQSMTPKDNQQQLSRKEVEELLRKGAYGSVMDDESEGNKFSEEDIDTILSRRTQTIRLEPGVKGSTFAKASFAASNNREDIDLQDPEFWSKWAKAMNVDVNTGDQSELIMSEPRTRRKRFEDNYKGLHEGENESDGSDDDGTEPGASKSRNRGGADFSKSRSGKKRKRDDDEDYINYVNNAPDELTFNKSEFFKVEKLLAAYGWGRWKIIKEHSDIALSEKDIEHISRTLLLHCIREFRGDEKSREFVWQLIVPKNAILGKGNKKGVLGGGLYHEGWAALPEYNPPAFAVDSSFQRHIHRHSNKLMQRMFHLFVLQAQILGSVDENTVQNKPHGEIPLDVPVIGDPPLSNWDADCDKSFLIGIYKHGMENFEAIRTDSKLCFIEKKIEEMPTTIELNTRFKRLILMLSRKLEMALAAATTVQNSNRLKRWPRDEEKEFMRLLRIYGVKDDHEGLNVINWKRFREISTNLQQKTDSELLEELYCVLAMCTKQQGGELSDIDRRRASLVDSIPSKQAERLMFRLHLMRKIHAIITTGIQNVRTSLKLCSNKTMPTGWQEIHDEQLMIVADMHGLDNMVSKVSQQPAFEKLKDSIDEPTLLRRIMEICTTLETGRWNGKGSIEMLEDDVLDESGTQTPVRSLGQKQANRSRKKNSTGTNPFASSASPANNTNQANSAAAAQAMMEAALLPLLTASATTGSSLQQQQQLQQFQALMTMYALSSMLPSGDASSAAANKQAMAALGLLGEDALNLTNPKKTATASTSLTSNANVKPSASTPVAGSATSKANDLTSQLNISELLALFNIPEDTNIPVVNIENNVKLTGDKAPKLKNLDQWLTAHPKYRVDTSVMGGPAPTQTSTTKESTTSAKPEKTEVGTSNGVFKANTLEAVETPKATTSATNATATSDAKKPSSDMDSIKIGVFYKSTGVALSQDKWPSITNLESWLIKNPSTQVQTVFAPFAKELLPKTMHDRIGGEPSGTQSSSASTSLQQAASSAAAANLTNAMNLEALQIQLYLQQKMMESLNPSAYQNPYSALLGAAGSTANAGLNSSISSSSTAGLDANSAALLALFGAQLPTTTLSSQTSTPATKNSNTSALNNANALSSAMNEAALTAEILANPSLALLLNSGALTNNNSAASLNSSLSSLPFGMDFNTALQLNALAQCAASPNVNSSAVSASLLSGTPASSKKAAQPTSSSKGLSKLDGIVEKLASSSQNANNSS